jgi:hypothetical protein
LGFTGVFPFTERIFHMVSANHPAARNARSALQSALECQWSGVPEPGFGIA